MLNKKMVKLISYAGIVLALLAVLLMPSSVAAEGGGVTCTVSANLTISNVSASNITTSSATISWETNDNATSQVFYDTVYHEDTAEYAYSVFSPTPTDEDPDLVTEHSIPLIGLSSGTTYHYRVRSAIPDTEFIAISEDYTFKTSSPPQPPVEEDGDGVGLPAYYTETNLFGTEAWFLISYSGELQKTVEATSEDGMLTVTILKGTVALDKYGKRLKGLEAAVDESPPDPPEDAHIIGLTYDFGPAGATFDPAITLEWSYDPDALPGGVAEEDLVIDYYDEDAGKWVELDCVVDTENNVITASVSHFSKYAIIGTVTPPLPPVIAPEEVEVVEEEVVEEEVVPPVEEVVVEEEEVVEEEVVEEEVVVLPFNWWPLIGIIATVVLAALLIYLILARRRAA